MTQLWSKIVKQMVRQIVVQRHHLCLLGSFGSYEFICHVHTWLNIWILFQKRFVFITFMKRLARKNYLFMLCINSWLYWTEKGSTSSRAWKLSAAMKYGLVPCDSNRGRIHNGPADTRLSIWQSMIRLSMLEIEGGARSFEFFSILCGGKVMDQKVEFDLWLASTCKSVLTSAVIENVSWWS